jgi:hypothetical protein
MPRGALPKISAARRKRTIAKPANGPRPTTRTARRRTPPDTAQPQRISPAAAGGIQENLKTYRALNSALANLDARPGSIGPGTGFLGDTFTQFNDPDGTDVRAGVGAVGAYKIHDLSGAAVSATEAPRFQPFVPTVTDRPEVAKKKLIQFRDALKAQIKEQLDFYGPANGYLPYQTPEAQQFLQDGQPDPNQQQQDAGAGGGGINLHRNRDKPPHQPRPGEQATYDPATDSWRYTTKGKEGGPPPLEVEVVGGHSPTKEEIDRAIAAQLKDTPALAAGVAGAADTASFGFNDEFGAGVDSFVGALQGKGSFGDLYDRNIAVDRGYKEALAARNPLLYGTGQFAGAALVPFGAEAKGAGGLAKVGAIQGTAYGLGSGEGSYERLPNALLGGVTGATVGAGLGYAGQKVGGILARRGPSPQIEAADAAGRLGIDMMPADAGGPATRTATAATAQTFLGAGPIVRGSQKAVDQAAAARGAIAAQAGGKLPADEAGEAVRKGGRDWIAATRQQASRLYDRVEQATRGTTIQPAQAIAAIDRHIAQLSEANGLGDPLIKELQKVRAAMENGISVNGLRSARTMLRGLSQTDALRGTPANHIFGEVLDAASADLRAGLVSQGKADAARMLGKADQFWRDRVEHIDAVLEPIIGKGKSGEDILRAVEGMTQGNRGGIVRLRGLMGSLEPQERSQVQATLIDRLGRAAKDNGEMDNFSAARFVTQWGQMSSKAKAVLFGNSPSRQALDDLFKVASQMKAADHYRNFSNSGGAVVNAASAAGVVTAVTSGNPTAIATAAGLGILNYASGKLLASPYFTRALVTIARTRAAPQKAMELLSRAGIKDPAISGEIQSLIEKAVNDNVHRAAADSGNSQEQNR